MRHTYAFEKLNVWIQAKELTREVNFKTKSLQKGREVWHYESN
jgi:hypothetical protein